MQTGEVIAATGAEFQYGSQRIASWRHLLGFLLIGVGMVALGILAQHHSGGNGEAEARQLAQHSQAIPIYTTAILMDWALLYYCWVGVHRNGGDWKVLAGKFGWSWKSLMTDVGIAAPFWVLWECTAWSVHRLLESGHGVLGANSAKTVDSLLPHSLIEVLLWIATAITAGICEELSFRGYLQRQFHALSGNTATAVAGQGAVFGLFHAYQGWKSVVVICVLGVLFGVLAEWRKNLRANVMVHAWADVWNGWLKFIVWT